MAPSRKKESIVIFGATSSLAQTLIKRICQDYENIILIARDQVKLGIVAQDTAARGAGKIHEYICDAVDHDALDNTFSEISGNFNRIDDWYFFHGVLPDQDSAQKSWPETFAIFNVNFLSICHWLTLIAERIEAGKSEDITVVSSVAGLRGRKSNYIYGTSKGALNIFLEGLRNRLSVFDSNVLTVLPGFIITSMTNGIDRKGILWVSPEKITDDILKAKSKNKDVLYTPWFWRYIMMTICAVPERFFKKMNL